MLYLGSVPEVSALHAESSFAFASSVQKKMCLVELIEVVQQTWVQELLGGADQEIRRAVTCKGERIF